MTLHASEILAGLPPVLVGRLEFCACGHTPDVHAHGARCGHVNEPNRKLALGRAPCTCQRFTPDPRLVDGEDFARRVLQKVLAKENLPVEQVDLEDALSVLIRQLWVTSAKYDSRSHVRFRVYAYLELYNDAIDHFRSEWGRNGQHRVHDQRVTNGGSERDGAAFVDRPDSVASRDPGDDPDDWATDLGGLLTFGDEPPAGLAGRPSRQGGRGDPGGDRGAVLRAAGRPGAAVARPRREPPRRSFVDCVACSWRTYLVPPNGEPGWHDPAVCGGCGAALDGERT